MVDETPSRCWRLVFILHSSCCRDVHVCLSRFSRTWELNRCRYLNHACIHMQDTKRYVVFLFYLLSGTAWAFGPSLCLFLCLVYQGTCVRFPNDYLKCSAFYLNKYSSGFRVFHSYHANYMCHIFFIRICFFNSLKFNLTKMFIWILKVLNLNSMHYVI